MVRHADLARMVSLTAQRARAGIKKISYQFPNTPEGKLFYAVVEQAVKDAVATEPQVKSPKDYFRHLIWEINAMSAANYLRSDMPHASQAGVDPEWIRRVFNSLGVDFGDVV